jgi:hypothetical protein
MMVMVGCFFRAAANTLEQARQQRGHAATAADIIFCGTACEDREAWCGYVVCGSSTVIITANPTFLIVVDVFIVFVVFVVVIVIVFVIVGSFSGSDT